MKLNELLKFRAEIFQKIRQFFDDRGVLEVETPMMRECASVDRYIDPFVCDEENYLHTSPEVFMKKILSRNPSDIFQICKVFRKNESGSIHLREFTMLEWYRMGWDHFKLMDEVEALFHFLGISQSFQKISYCEIFEQSTGINPVLSSIEEIRTCACENGYTESNQSSEKDDYLNYCFNVLVEPNIDSCIPTFIFHYPASQAILSRICPDNPFLSERFELYFNGIEICNGFHELNDSSQVKERFNNENKSRQNQGKSKIKIDDQFVECMQSLPDCSGVALGLDRLIMCITNIKSIDDVIAFEEINKMIQV